MTSLGKIKIKKSQKFAVCRFYAADITERPTMHIGLFVRVSLRTC